MILGIEILTPSAVVGAFAIFPLAAGMWLLSGRFARPPALSPSPREEDRPPLAALTRRELEVARLAASAYTAAEIGRRLNIGERTVESHLASTYLKLGITSRSELIRMAEKLG